MKLDFNDLLIVPKETSDISTRSIINPFDEKGFLPLITAPMDTVINKHNHYDFYNLKIIPCMSRGEDYVGNRDTFKSYSLKEIETILKDKRLYLIGGNTLIDVANGHMSKIIDLVIQFKELFPKDKLMVGNVANPDTYEILSQAGADYVRVGIGNGGGCLTTQNTGVGYPMASLIKECYEKSLYLKKSAYIVADGGMQTYSDIIKALALGADYVMVGNIFNKALESAGDNFILRRFKVSRNLATKLYDFGIPIYKKYRGMSTKEVQRKWGNEDIKTSEGVVRYRKVEYTLSQWCENFEHYLRSAMSYTGAHNLYEFIGKVKLIEITDNAYKRFNK